jgi:DNA (cytosine-5)-methyltransferase 1
MGGFSLGLRLAGLQTRTVAYVEWEQYPQEIIKARIKDGFLDDAPIWGDISTLNGEQFRGVVDLITAGFPCQPHSVAGLKQGADDERNLWPETLRVISEVEPRYVILENVPGILSASTNDGTPAYGGTVVGELAQIGYGVHWQTIGADDVGAPHRRKRWWCIGVASAQQWKVDKATASGANVTRRVITSYPSSPMDDPEHDGYARSQDSGCAGSRVHPPRRAIQPEQSTRSGGGATGGEELADSDGTGSTSHTRDHGKERRLSEAHSEQEHGASVLGGSGAELVNSDSNATQGMEQGSQQGRYQRQAGLSSRTASQPTWPPSPSDTSGWEQVIRVRPDLAPALTKETESQFRRVADGRSHRVDELKALGNGLLPAVATEFLRRIIRI